MRVALVFVAMAVLAACDASETGVAPAVAQQGGPGGALPEFDRPAVLTDRDRVIMAIEASGCVVIADNADEGFARSGVSEAEFRRIGAELVADGLADVSRVGVYRLETPYCAI